MPCPYRGDGPAWCAFFLLQKRCSQWAFIENVFYVRPMKKSFRGTVVSFLNATTPRPLTAPK